MIFIGVSAFLISLVQGVVATEVILLDSNVTALGNWTSIQHDGDSFPADKHNTALYAWAKSEDLNYNKLAQYFHVCSFREAQTKPQNNWLRSPVFNISDAVALEVDIEFLVTMCSDKLKYPYCADKVTMYYQFTDDGNENDPINGTNYQLSTHLPLDNSMLDRRQKVTVKINVTSPRKRGMVIAFRDTGGCPTIYRVVVRYTYCPSTIRYLITFPRTVVQNSVVSVKGQCQANATLQSSSQPEMLCLTNGKWSAFSGSCICNAGYSNKYGVCEACVTGFYKESLGNAACLPCPLNSYSSNVGSTNCTCLERYSRLKNGVDENCTAPPGPARNVTIEEKSLNLIRISWKPPSDDGGRSDLRYKISINLRNGSLLMSQNTSLTTYSFSDAKPDTYYEIKVMAFNRAGYGQFVVLSTKTSAPPGSPRDVTIEEKSSNVIRISWKPPNDDGGRSDLRYKISIRLRNGSLLVLQNTSLTTYSFSDAKPNTYYEIKVMAFNGAGYGQFVVLNTKTSASSSPSPPANTTFRPTDEGSSSKVNAITIVVIVVGVVLVAAV